MGTHPIFESDFDCLTDMINVSVGDVWQLAAEISSNLERLTNEIGIGKIQGVVTPTVRALELLEKLAEERSKLIEEKLIQDQVIESLKRKPSKASNETEINEIDDQAQPDDNNNIDTEQIQKFLEEKIRTKNEENLKLAKTVAENKVNDTNQIIELERQRQVMSSMERRVTELSDDLRIKESTINELEKDCDTLENEANRLLNINRELRVKLGEEVPQNLDFLDESGLVEGERSFACELIENGKVDERPGPEGEEREDLQKESKKSEDEITKPRYTLFELEEVLNEKNKYKERCFVLEEKLREVTGDDTITWQGLSINDLESVETSTGTIHNRGVMYRNAIHPTGDKRSIRSLMTRFFRSPTVPTKTIVSESTYLPTEPIDQEIKAS